MAQKGKKKNRLIALKAALTRRLKWIWKFKFGLYFFRPAPRRCPVFGSKKKKKLWNEKTQVCTLTIRWLRAWSDEKHPFPHKLWTSISLSIAATANLYSQTHTLLLCFASAVKLDVLIFWALQEGRYKSFCIRYFNGNSIAKCASSTRSPALRWKLYKHKSPRNLNSCSDLNPCYIRSRLCATLWQLSLNRHSRGSGVTVPGKHE